MPRDLENAAPEELAPLVAAVQANCDIADARHAADLSLCNFLLQMREYYRWEHGLGFDATLDRAVLGRWLAAREQAWAALEERDFGPLPVAGEVLPPFELEAITQHLCGVGLVYGAGWVDAGRAGFFLAELLPDERDAGEAEDGLRVQHCGRELARGLFAPPAALQGGHTIVLRRESLARWIWERYEAFSLRRADGAFHAVARAFGLHDTASFVAALPGLCDEVATVLLLHERGEFLAAARLEPGWGVLRQTQTDRRAAQWLRAVRDHVADLSVTLPTLLAQGSATAIHFWFATFEGPRQAFFPALDAAYRAWCAGDGGRALREACAVGAAHFEALAHELLALGDPLAVARRLADPGIVLA